MRLQKAAEALKQARLDSLLVTSLHNVRYLTGFTGSNGAVIVRSDGDAILFTDPRYTVQAKQQATCRVRIVKGPLTPAIVAELRRGRNGFEKDHMTVGQSQSLPKLLPASGIVERLRIIKDDDEIAAIRASVNGNSAALEKALAKFRPGMTESALAAEIDYQNRKLGAESPAFDTIVAAGARAALPHAHPGPTKIGPGILLIDMGAFRDGYASDMTRMAYIGKPDAQYKKAYAAVLEAQLAAIDAVKAGATTKSVDGAARKVLRRHGLAKEFIHSTGHGLGLEIHEGPRIAAKDTTSLEAGMAITIEPGVYIEGWGGIRIEDTVLVTSTGCEVLTPGSKQLRTI